MSPLVYLALFGAGVSSVAAPCVLPLLPAYATVVVDAGSRGGARAVVTAAVTFVAGFGAVFVALGVIAGTLGAAAAGAATWLTRVGGVALAAMGAALLLGLEHRLGSARAVHRIPAAGSRWRPLVLGVAFGAAWTPCVGPFLATALVAASTAGPWVGAALLATYSAGLAVPFLTLCLAASAASSAAPRLTRRLGRHAGRWQRLAGAALVGLGVLLATGRATWFTSAVGG